MPFDKLGYELLATACYVLLGLAMFGLAFWIITKLARFSIRKEIADDQNTALAIIIGSIMIGIALIVAAAVHG